MFGSEYYRSQSSIKLCPSSQHDSIKLHNSRFLVPRHPKFRFHGLSDCLLVLFSSSPSSSSFFLFFLLHLLPNPLLLYSFLLIQPFL